MNGETALTHIESKLDTHIEQHNEDYRKLLSWVIATLIGLLGSVAGWFVTMGAIQEKVAQLEVSQRDKIPRAELASTIELFNEKLKNFVNKLDVILKAVK